MMTRADRQMAWASHSVVPAQTGIQWLFDRNARVPACTGTTRFVPSLVMPAKAGIQKKLKRDARVLVCTGTTDMENYPSHA